MYIPMPGIYYILNIANDRIYIGETGHIPERIRQHRAALTGNYHTTESLQDDWNTYGANNFEFGILTTTGWSTQKQRIELERTFIRAYQSEDPALGYNVNAQAKSRSAVLSRMAQGNYTTRPRKRQP